MVCGKSELMPLEKESLVLEIIYADLAGYRESLSAVVTEDHRKSSLLRALLLRCFRGLFVAKHSGKDLVDVLQLPLQIEGVLYLLPRNFAGDLLVGKDLIMEIQTFFPRTHGVGLHQAISIFAAHAILDQIEQELSAENEAAGALKIGTHPIGIDEHRVNHLSGFG